MNNTSPQTSKPEQHIASAQETRREESNDGASQNLGDERDRKLLDTIVAQMAENTRLALEFMGHGVGDRGVKVFVGLNTQLAEMGSNLGPDAAVLLKSELQDSTARVLGALSHNREGPGHV